MPAPCHESGPPEGKADPNPSLGKAEPAGTPPYSCRPHPCPGLTMSPPLPWDLDAGTTSGRTFPLRLSQVPDTGQAPSILSSSMSLGSPYQQMASLSLQGPIQKSRFGFISPPASPFTAKIIEPVPPPSQLSNPPLLSPKATAPTQATTSRLDSLPAPVCGPSSSSRIHPRRII